MPVEINLEEDLTKRYSSFFETNRLARPMSFARDVYLSGKLRELSSFIVWELLHRLRLFPAKSYLDFTSYKPLVLESDGSSECPGLDDRVKQILTSLGLHTTLCEQNWKLVYLRPDGGFLGCRYPNDNEVFESDHDGAVNFIHSFHESIKSIFVSSRQMTFVCVKGGVYRRVPDSSDFVRVMDFASPQSFFRHNNGMAEMPDGTLVIGEYGNVWNHKSWKNLAYLYSSSDDGMNWKTTDFLIRRGTNKHVHVVKYISLLNKLFVADGDNHKRLWMTDAKFFGDWNGTKWTTANRFHIQMGGYTSIVEADYKLFFGTDYQGGTNFIVESTNGETFTKKVIPDPYRQSPIDNMLVRKSSEGMEIWANLPYSTAASKCLLMFTRDAGKSWNRVVEYDRKNHIVWLISSSSHAPESLYLAIEDRKTKYRRVFKVGEKR